MFDRVISLIGSDKFKKINESTILVVGLGGVGGYAVESLVRSGIGKIVLIDYDKIDDSNLNRQIITNRSNIGEYKTNEWKTRIKSINPDCEVIIYNMFLDKDNIAQISDLEIDYIDPEFSDYDNSMTIRYDKAVDSSELDTNSEFEKLYSAKINPLILFLCL